MRIPGMIGGGLLAAGVLACLIMMGCQGEQRRTPRSPRRAAEPDPVLFAESSRSAPDELGEGTFQGSGPAGWNDAIPSDQDPLAGLNLPGGGAAPAGNRRTPQNVQEVLQDLNETQRLKLAEAEYHLKLGNDAYEALEYAKAMEEYRKALDINPALEEAREKWARAGMVLGVRSAEVESIRRELTEADRVRKAQRLQDAKLGLEEGRELLQSGDFENAERKYRKVYEELLWFEYPVDITELRQQAKSGIDMAEEAKRRHESDTRTRLERAVSVEKEKQLSEEKRIRQQQIRELVRRAADYFSLKDYEKGIDACKRILELDPTHRVAKFWLREMQQQELDQRKLRIHRERIENQLLTTESIEESAVPYTDIFVFPEEREWNRIRRREETLQISLEDPDWIRRIKNALESQTLTFAFEQRPLKEVLPFLSDQTGINIISDPAVNTEEFLIDLAAKDMKAMDALNQILTMSGLAYTFKENTLYITEKEKARGDVKFAIYNVTDILNRIRDFEGPTIQLKSRDEDVYGAGGGQQQISFTGGLEEEGGPLDPDALIELIREGSGGDEAWGEDNTIEHHKGQLLVNATTEIHKSIQTTLESLREDSDLFVVIEARFIDVNDDFLEDIGIDSRALGAGSNFGTPFANILNDNSTSGNDIGFVKTGSPVRDVTLIMGQDRWAGRIQHIVDGFTGLVQGTSLQGGPGSLSGLTIQATWLEPFQINVIIRAVQEKLDVRQLTAPIITAHNGQRVYVSVITQRAYIADYELVSGGTGFSIIEVADPVVQTFQEGVILDVDPVISPDKKYVTLDVRPTLASLIGGIISTIQISLGSFTNVAFQVPIGVPEISLQQSFTSVTVPNGGTVLLGGFKSLLDARFKSYLPILGKIPIIRNLFRRQAKLLEKRSLVILITARIVDLRADERNRYNE